MKSKLISKLSDVQLLDWGSPVSILLFCGKDMSVQIANPKV